MEELAHVYKSTPMDMEQAHVHEVITVDIGMDEEMEEHVYEEIIELQYMKMSSGRNVSQEIENTSGGMSAVLPTAKSQQSQLCHPVNIHMRLSPPKQETREKTPPLPPKPGTILPYNQLCIYQCYHPNYTDVAPPTPIPILPPKPPPKPVSHVTPATSGSEGVYMPLRMTMSRQQEEDHYMPLCDATRENGYVAGQGRHVTTAEANVDTQTM